MKKRVVGIGLMVSLIILAAPLVQMAGAAEIKREKVPSSPGGGGTDVYTVTLEKGKQPITIYYVLEGAITIRTKFMEEFAKSPVGSYVGESIRNGVSIEDIVTKGVDKGYSPCDLLKGLIVNGAQLKQVVKIYLEKSLLPPCGVLRCALDAVRGLQTVEVEAGHYSIITPGGCAIGGDFDIGEARKTFKMMMEEGLFEEALIGWPPEKSQVAAAGCCETVELAQVLLAAGADLEDLRACLNTMGCSGLGYASPPPPPPPPPSPPGPPSGSM